METSNIKNSNLRDAETLGKKVIHGVQDGLQDASPKAREAIDQMTDIVDNLYGKATDWLNEGNNRNYVLVGLAASAGVLGFLLGRGMKAKSEDRI